MVARLTDERSRLDELRYGGIDVFGRLADAYQVLSARQRWTFRRLAGSAGAPLTVGQLAELVSMPPVIVQNVLDELVDADLVEELETPDGQLRHQVPALFRLVGLSGRLASSW
jgi:hypothetical protein